MWKLVILAVGLIAAAIIIIASRRPMPRLVAELPADTSTDARPTPGTSADAPAEVATGAPEFAPGTVWLQSEPITLASLRGQVVVVHFWTFGCINCIHNYPAYKAWQEQYGGKGVTIIGIHTPETEGEADLERVRAKSKQNGLTFPIAVDNRGQNWRNWDNRYWPSIYLIDKRGRVRYRWEGELDFGTTKGERHMLQKIGELLAEEW